MEEVSDQAEAVAVAAKVSRRHPQLRLLLLFGSRARGNAHRGSDWDFGFLADPGLDRDALLADLVTSLGSEKVDLADLARSSALVRFRAARDGRPLHERDERAFARFWLEAVDFWCDAGPVIRAGYHAILDGLGA